MRASRIGFLMGAALAALPYSAFAVPPPAEGVVVPPETWEALREFNRRDHRDSNLARTLQQIKAVKEAQRANPDLQLTAPSLGTVRIPMILANYSDTSPNLTCCSNTLMDNHIFESNPDGTMRTYYQEISYNQLTLQGDTFGWVTAPQTQAYYVSTNNGLGATGRQYARDSAIAADPSIDYGLYDANNDCIVDVIMVVHTDGGAESGDSDNIWSHRWTVTPDYLTGDVCPSNTSQNMRVRDYIIQPAERGNGTADLIKHIGVYCHEFGHALGLPDLYDTDDSSEGLGHWDLMAAGSYGGNGAHEEKPAHMSAWSKIELGWAFPANVTANLYAEPIATASATADFYRIETGGGIGDLDYFLVENRQPTDFDLYLPQGGLLIYHVDDGQAGVNNDDETHYRVGLQQADGLWHLNNNANRGDAGDPFPGSTGNRTLGPTTNPSSQHYDRLSSFFVRTIGDPAATMTADLIVNPGAPEGLRMGDTDMDGDVQMDDARRALRTFLGLEVGAGCAYPSLLVSDNLTAGVEDAMLIGQYANGQAVAAAVDGPPAGPVQLLIDSGNNQSGVTGETLPVPLVVEVRSRDTSVCYSTYQLPAYHAISADTTGGASLENLITGQFGGLVGSLIPDNFGRTEDVALTLGTGWGSVTVGALTPIHRADRVFLMNATASYAPFAQTCGNGAVDLPSGEECDDGNTTAGDGCSSACAVEFCGDGYQDSDGPNNLPGDGDDEACDDGNTSDGDGCSATCQVEGFSDPLGDLFTNYSPPEPSWYPDIQFYSVSRSGPNIVGYLTTPDPIDPTQFYVYMDINTDQNGATGSVSAADSFPWIPGNVVPHNNNWEYQMRLRPSPPSTRVVINTGGFIQCNPVVSFSGNRVDFSFPLTCIGGDDGLFDYTLTAGGYICPSGCGLYGSDVAPNAGFETTF